MEDSSSRLSLSAWERRKAWANQYCTRRRMTIEEETSSAPQETSELQPPLMDDAFLQGNSSSKIESWLGQSSSSGNPFRKSLSVPGASGSCSNRTSFEDDLSLGAEATFLLDQDRAESRLPTDASWSELPLNLDHSLTSSSFSASTNKTSSSISEVLECCKVDAERVLSNLGFIQEETPATSWIPARFFADPSQAQGIDFQLFLRAQVQRLEMEDPYLMLASRFKQVRTLALTADAFFCLYSYVSKTPVQKISPAHLFSSFPDISDSWNASCREETKPSLQRLKEAISRMCLYTSPREGGTSGPPQAQSHMSRLEQIVWEVMDLARKKRLHVDVENGKENAPMVHSGSPLFPRRTRSASSMSTIEAATPRTSSCFCFEGPSQTGERMEIPPAHSMLDLDRWLSHCAGGASTEGPGHLGNPEQCCYERHSLTKPSSPEVSSEELEGDWSAEKGSTIGEVGWTS